MGEAKGGCLCGAVRYTLKNPPEAVVLCHCSHCQKVTGSAFSTNALVAEADIAFDGEMASYADTADSGNSLSRRFCGRCGSSLGSQSPRRPGIFILKVGTLDDSSALRTAAAQIWTRSKQPWVAFAFETQMFEQGR